MKAIHILVKDNLKDKLWSQINEKIYQNVSVEHEINGKAKSTYISLVKVSSLDHEILDDTMKCRTFEAKALLS